MAAGIHTELSNLLLIKDKIDKSIVSLESKKKILTSNLTVVLPTSSIDIQIHELQFDKQIVNLRRQQKQLEIEFQHDINNISDEEFTKQVDSNNKNANNQIKAIDDQISVLNVQKDKLDAYKNIKKKNVRLKNIKNNRLKAVRTDRAKNIINTNKFVFQTSTTVLASVLSKIIYNKMISSNSKLGNLSIMVDKVNIIIDNASTKQDIINATLQRNNALKLLNDVESNLVALERLLKTIERIVQILLIVIKVIKLAASFVFLPGPKALIQNKLTKAELILGTLQIVLNTAVELLKKLVDFVEELKSRLHDIGSLIDDITSNPGLLDSSEIDNLLTSYSANFGKLGMLSETYKGFRFAIKEEVNKLQVVQGHKRRYAVAINKDNSEVLQSEYSFTLDPNVLIEQLKILIDQKNLST